MKLISHLESFNTPCDFVVHVETRPVTRVLRVERLDEKTNRVYTKLEKKTVTRAEEMKPYKVSDFFLDNLLAIGATLNPSHLTASPHKAVTDMEKTLSNIKID